MPSDNEIVCPSCGRTDLRGRPGAGGTITTTCENCANEWSREPRAICPICSAPYPIATERWGWEFHDDVEARDNAMAGYDDVLRAEFRCRRCHNSWRIELGRRNGRETPRMPGERGTGTRQPRLSVDAPIPTTYPNPRNDDPWDNDAVHWLLEQADGRSWTRGQLFECLRRQPNQVAKNPDRVQAAAQLAAALGVEQRDAPYGRGRITRLYRTDAAAPAYPATDEDRRRLVDRARHEQ